MAATSKQTPRKVVRRSNTGGTTTTAILTWFRDFVATKTERTRFEAREKELKGRLKKAVQERGYEDDKGHWWFDLPEEIGGYSKLKREKRKTSQLNEERARELLREKSKKVGKDLEKACLSTVVVFDGEKFAKIAYEYLDEDEFDSLIDENVTWAFVPSK